MKKIIFFIFFLTISTISLFGQLANWEAYKPTKFPVNRSGQIHGQARVVQMKFHATNPNKYYAITAQGGLFISTDAGANWSVSAGTDALSIKNASICIDYTNDQIMYLGGGDPNYYGSGSGIYKSTNGGTTFTQLTGGLPTGRIVLEILMHPTDNNTIVAATSGGIYKSTNGGTTWAATTGTSLQFCDMKAVANANSMTLFACTATNTPELYRSTDFGSTWTLISSGLTTPSVPNIQGGSRIAVTPADSNVVYFAMVSSGGMIFKSTDKGLNFSLMKAGGSPYLTYYTNDVNDSGQGNYNFCITVDRTNANTLWLQSHNTWTSNDAGATWTKLTDWWAKVHTDMHQITQSPYDASKLYSCNDGGVWLSTDGGNNWTPKHDGIFAFEIGNYAGKGSPTRRDFVNIGTQDNGELYADSTGWYCIRGGDWYANNEIDYRANSTMMYYHESNLRRSLSNLSSTTYGLPANTLNWKALEFNRTDANLAFIGLTDTVFRSNDVTATTPTWTNIGKLNSTIKAIHSSIADPNRLYVITSDQKMYVSSNALDPSPTFTPYNLPSAVNSTATIAAICSNKNIVYIAINTRVYRSADGGATWTNITYNLPSVNHRRILAEEYGGTEELVFVATNNAVYYKKAGQTTWTNYSTNLPNRQSPTELSMYDDGTNNALIRYTSYGRGVWQTPFGNLRPLAAYASVTKSADPCVGNTFTFNNTSNGSYTSVSWSFPGGTPSSSTAENPVVSYPSVGNYTATLTVTDALNNTSSTTVNVEVTRIDYCSTDGYAGKTLQLSANNDYFIKSNINLSNVTAFSTTAWIKPNGAQSAYAGIVSNGDWCAHCPNNTNGLVFDYYGTKLWFRWAGIDDTWANNSGMTVPLNQWSYVAMVITQDSVALYLNDQKYVYQFPATGVDRPTAASFTDLYLGLGHYSGYFKGEIDEVTVWNRALTQHEIRELRHLTKENAVASDPSLLAYYQFNDVLNGVNILDKKRNYHGTLNGNATLGTSTAPVGSGVSERMNITTSGVKTFSTPNVAIEFPTTGTLPNGEVVVTRINSAPNQNPSGGTAANKYWIVNNYGSNSTFYGLKNIKFNDLSSFATGTASNFKLYKRNANDEGATWGSPIDGADVLNSNALTFTPASLCKAITGFGQFTITDDAATPPSVSLGADCELSPVSGKAMYSTANGDYLLTPAISLNKDDGSNNNQITLMAWVRPIGTQSSFAGIITCNGVNINLNLRSNNEIGFHWNDAASSYNWSTGLYLPANEWSHIALVTSATDVKIYLNGKAATLTFSTPTLNIAARQWSIGRDRTTSSRTFKGLIDEVCLYNRTLSQDEIREKMHLVKDPTSDASLKGYFQFNETSGSVYNKADTYTSNFSGTATRATSLAPVATGTSQRMTVTTSGVKDFTNQHLSLTFPAGTLPNGEIVVTELAASPSLNPATGTPLSNKYWIVNNYGTNTNFSALAGMNFNNLGNFIANQTASYYKLYKRNSTTDTVAWGASIGNGEALTTANNNTLTFGSSANITSFSQFTIANETPLPIELLDFQAIARDNKVDMTWKIADETTVNHYIVEHATDSKNFKAIQKENKGIFNTQDPTPQYGINYYRLKIVENDGSVSYSATKSVVIYEKDDTRYAIYPNPTSDMLNIQFNTDKEQNTDIELRDNLGRTVYQYHFTTKNGNNHLFFGIQNFASGIYVLHIKQGNKIATEKVVIK